MRPGSIIASRFTLERLAGTGGMGSVFRALDAHTGAPVALKIAHGTHSQAVDRFAREAAVLSELRHPGIVQYVAHGREPDGTLYLAMEWLEGIDLTAFLAARPLSVADAVALVRRVAEALGAAHARGVVHRDVKPSNVFLPGGDLGRATVLDFGVARLTDDAAMTRTGMVLGTPTYMAPEQARGDRDIDARADVFALGSLLFECLTGKPPFFAEHPMGALAKILLEEAPSVRERRRDVPEDLEALLRRMLTKDRDARPADGAALAVELAAIDVEPLSRVPASLFRPALTEGEQRLLSVLLVGEAADATAATAATAPTESREQVVRTLLPVSEVVAAHGGQMERLAGGALVVSLRGAGAATDQAARAARCALAIRALRPEAPMALSMGRSVVLEGTGRLAEPTRLPAGEVIDRGAALLRAAAAVAAAATNGARIRIDEVTAGLLDGRFEVGGDPAGLVLRGEREEGQSGRTLLGRPTPCVGRERDVGALLGLLDECIATPMARGALVTAPAGVGKSRLRLELLRQIRERRGGPDAPEVWMARGDPMSKGSPFGLLGQAIRSAAGVLGGEPLAVRQQKLRARVGRHLAGEALARTAEFLGEIAGTPFPAPGPDGGAPRTSGPAGPLAAARQNARLMGDLMQKAWEDFLAAECAAQPVVLVLEDLHWGDLPTVQLVDAALRNLEDQPLLVLAFARPEVHQIFPRLWADRAVEEIRLAELSRPSCKRLVRAVLGDTVADETVQQIVERAAGNAFYLEELVRAVAEGKVAVGQGGGLALPETVLAMVEARLETLGPELRRVLRAASVFGQAFWQEGVATLLGAEGQDLAPSLRALDRQELISRRSESRFPGTAEYVFRHGFVREAAYAMLTDDDRPLGHRLAGEWLTAAGEGESLVLAEHFERGGSPERAVTWYERAAGQALEGNDFVAALDRAERAVRCGATGETLGRLRVRESEAHSWRGEYALSGSKAREALALAARGSAEWLQALSRAAGGSARLGERAEVERLARELLDLGPAGAGPKAAWAQLAMMVGLEGNFPLADELLAQVEAALGLGPGPASPLAPGAPAGGAETPGGPTPRPPADPFALGHYHQAQAACRAARGDDVDGMRDALDLAIAAFDRAGDARNACQARVNAGFACIEMGAFEEAEDVLRRGIEVAERLGLANVAATGRQNLGLAVARLGRLDEGSRMETEAIEAFIAYGDRRMECSSHCYLAEILRLGGALEGAEREARAAVAIARPGTTAELFSLAQLTLVLLAEGRAPEALEVSGQAFAGVERLGAGGEGDLRVHLAHAEALHASGAEDRAREAILVARSRALARAERIGTPERSKAYLERVPEVARILALAAAWER